MRMPAALLTFVLASAALSSCGSSPKTHLYALSESQATFAPDDASGQVYSVGITAVSLPEIVDRPQLVLRKGGNEIVLEEQHRWAEPLKRALPRVIALNLSRRLGNVRVASHPQNGLSDADYLIALDFHRFEAWHEVEIRLDVSWRVLGTDRKAMTTRRAFIVESTTDDHRHAAVVAALDRGIDRLGLLIAESIIATRERELTRTSEHSPRPH